MGYWQYQDSFGYLRVLSRVKMVTLIREDLGLEPGLVIGPSLNLVGSRLQFLCHPERQYNSRAVKAWTLAHNGLSLNPSSATDWMYVLGEVNFFVHLFPYL